MTDLLSLRCWIVGDDPARAFEVDVPKSGSVSALKDAIKLKQQPDLDNWPANKLDVWAVAVPLTNEKEIVETAEKATNELRLEGWKLLRKVDLFKSPDEEHLHVVVRTPEGTRQSLQLDSISDCLILLYSPPSIRSHIDPIHRPSRSQLGYHPSVHLAHCLSPPRDRTTFPILALAHFWCIIPRTQIGLCPFHSLGFHDLNRFHSSSCL
jgi:hypothetical protein